MYSMLRTANCVDNVDTDFNRAAGVEANVESFSIEPEWRRDDAYLKTASRQDPCRSSSRT